MKAQQAFNKLLDARMSHAPGERVRQFESSLQRTYGDLIKLVDMKTPTGRRVAATVEQKLLELGELMTAELRDAAGSD